MRTIEATWEQRNLGVRAYEVELGQSDDITTAIKHLGNLKAKADYIVCKCETNCSDSLFSLPPNGFVFIETQITLYYSPKDDCVHPSIADLEELFVGRFSFEDVTDSDIGFALMLENIEKHSLFSTDRVYLDPTFPHYCAAKRYAGWCCDLRNCGARFLNVMFDGALVGFTVYCDKGAGRITSPLGGYFDFAQESALLGPLGSRAFFSYLLDRGMKSVETWVSSNNKVITEFHLSAGYKVRDMRYVYVWHSDGCRGVVR